MFPLVVTLFAVVLPAVPASVVRLPNAFVPPTAAANVVTPLLFTVNVSVPAVVAFTVPVKSAVPVPVVTVVFPASVLVFAALKFPLPLLLL